MFRVRAIKRWIALASFSLFLLQNYVYICQPCVWPLTSIFWQQSYCETQRCKFTATFQRISSQNLSRNTAKRMLQNKAVAVLEVYKNVDHVSLNSGWLLLKNFIWLLLFENIFFFVNRVFFVFYLLFLLPTNRYLLIINE